mmetsp:Transcript_47633/g.101911  ORF Transcript_47633/g.101911 Transcript_47633/m.101911 type:complete len:789 (-) Transcript_47633:55-2421(-)
MVPRAPSSTDRLLPLPSPSSGEADSTPMPDPSAVFADCEDVPWEEEGSSPESSSLRRARPLTRMGSGDGRIKRPRRMASAVQSFQLTAEAAIRMLVPRAGAAVYGRLGRERIRMATDLASLDKDDLSNLGLTMVERARVLRWAREAFAAGAGDGGDSPDTSPGTPGYGFGAELCSWMRPPETSWPPEVQLEGGAGSATDASAASMPRAEMRSGDKLASSAANSEEDLENRRLDEIEQQADFWCSLVIAASPEHGREATATSPPRPGRPSDLREEVLEALFDVTPERVAEVYSAMHRESIDAHGHISEVELSLGLRRCGLVGLDDKAMTKILRTVNKNRQGGLKLAEFEAILSRLKMAQLLVGRLDSSSLCVSPGSKASDLEQRLGQATPKLSLELSVHDYNPHSYSHTEVRSARVREFLFGHRPRTRAPREVPLVRWVHMCDFDVTTLLALTVKYSLHPLGVEDVMEQCPTKLDRHGSHYFAAVEQLCLVGGGGSRGPVQVMGQHVAVFCSGPPLFDTVITVAQPDRSFAEDWPGGAGAEEPASYCGWAQKLRQRLAASRSRLRERRADFLTYEILDLCTDEFLAVTRAYATRLCHLSGVALCGEASQEISLVKMQLALVVRRTRGLQRLLRHLTGCPDLSMGLGNYLQDVADHLNEVHEDATQLMEKCQAIAEAHQQAADRRKEAKRQHTADRLNQLLFVLTVATFIFAPVQFLAGVYGMNFQNSEGTPTMPLLVSKNGYSTFWRITVTYFAVSIAFGAYLFWRILYRNDDRGIDASVQDFTADNVV